MSFWAFYIGIKLNFQAVIKSAASAASRRSHKKSKKLTPNNNGT